MIAIGNLPAIHALIAAINRDSVLPAKRLLAVQRFRQCLRNGFELTQLVPGKKIRMRQPPAFQRTLQQSHPLHLLRKILKCHAAAL
jgi:hypothetical protein